MRTIVAGITFLGVTALVLVALLVLERMIG
jgi:hypothetical protein